MADDSQEVADIIDALGEAPSPIEVYHATRNYDTRYLASAGAAAAQAGGGGSQPNQGLTRAFPVVLDDCQFALVGNAANDLNYDYDNGPDNDGIGSTMTCQNNEVIGSTGVENDWGGVQVGDRVAVADYPDGFFGVFTITDLGEDDPDGSPWVLTRATDADTPETFVRCWAVRITLGSIFDGATLQVLAVEAPLSDPAITVEDFTTSGQFFIDNSRGGFAFGKGATATGINAFAFGESADASGSRAVAIGSIATATGNDAVAIGSVTAEAGETVIAATALFLNSLPTSVVGLPAGQIYIDGTTLKVAP